MVGKEWNKSPVVDFKQIFRDLHLHKQRCVCTQQAGAKWFIFEALSKRFAFTQMRANEQADCGTNCPPEQSVSEHMSGGLIVCRSHASSPSQQLLLEQVDCNALQDQSRQTTFESQI